MNSSAAKKSIAGLIIVLSVTLTSLFSFVQEKELESTLNRMIQEAISAIRNEDYNRAINYYLQILSYPDAASVLNNTYLSIIYNTSCCYSLLGNTDKAFEYLEKAIEAGYINSRKIMSDPDFRLLREEYPDRVEMILEKINDKRESIRLSGSPIAIVLWDNYDGPISIEEHPRLSSSRIDLNALRDKHKLLEITKSGKTEFEKFKLLLNWVATRWEHDGNNTAGTFDALDILERAEKGERFACVDYALVFKQCLLSLGYPSRYIGIRESGMAASRLGMGHSCVEVWSNQYQKWIFFDAQNNAWWESEGVPLSAYECRDLYLKGEKNSLDLVGQHQHFDYKQKKEEWITYFYNILLPFKGSYVILISDQTIPELFLNGLPEDIKFTKDVHTLYLCLNQTKIEFQHTDLESPSSTLKITLKHTMPCFEKFLVRINDGQWAECESNFQLTLVSGENSIEAKAVNQRGIEGRPSKVVLINNISSTVPDKKIKEKVL